MYKKAWDISTHTVNTRVVRHSNDKRRCSDLYAMLFHFNMIEFRNRISLITHINASFIIDFNGDIVRF